MEENPSNIKEESLSLNPKQPSEKKMILLPHIPQDLSVTQDEPLKAQKIQTDASPTQKTNKAKKQIMFQNIDESNRRDSKLQELLREKRQSQMPSGSNNKGRGNSPVKSTDKDVDVFKVKVEIKNKWITRADWFLNSNILQFPITLLTVYALFFGDVKFLISSKNDDYSFDALFFLSMSCFTFEIILSMLVRKDYVFSFFFWLDITSTATLLFDLSMVSSNIL